MKENGGKMKNIKMILIFIMFFTFISYAHDYFYKDNFYFYTIKGDTTLHDDYYYISFAGDFGYNGELFNSVFWPNTEELEKFTNLHKQLLDNFNYNIINFEFSLYKNLDKDVVGLLKNMGFDAVSLANNHSLDYAEDGIDYNSELLHAQGINIIGTRENPFLIANNNAIVWGIADYIDKDNSSDYIVRSNESYWDYFNKENSKHKNALAFIHLGSASKYQSPHEKEQIDKLFSSGFDNIICTGSHFKKGYYLKENKAVMLGIGNHLFSYCDDNTEDIGMYCILGYKDDIIKQIFLIPFYRETKNSKLSVLSKADFMNFTQIIEERSKLDQDNFYKDNKMLDKIIYTLKYRKINALKQFKWRHVKYGFKTIYAHFPLLTLIFLGILVLVLILIFYKIWVRLNK